MTLDFSVIAPSQPGKALAGVQKPVRQHSPGVFFQTSPADEVQLPTSWAEVAAAKPISDKASARDFKFFMIFLREFANFRQDNKIYEDRENPLTFIVPQFLNL
jgi:hypothetical protein